ncbi:MULTISPECIES: phosphoribosyltransferase [unclassified Microbulbifer]|uniref:phosphoribosyltransferase n=1 Tax=unclassified Microbulbifer TaxID=2619833 RepID=UPI0027E43089|nr:MULTISPECIES: phosphoribosyltransferase [unclassified Microbulbifer]
MTPFENRTEAGRQLAESLRHSFGDRKDLIVLALPRGGVPVGLEVARALKAPLDLILVRKLGVPGHKELAMGAITSHARVLNEEVIRSCGVSDEALEEVAREEQRELERRAGRYRGDRPWPELKDRCVILVDDGIATGATMEAAARAVREQKPASLVLAVPVAPPETLRRFSSLADKVECLMTPEAFWAIGAWYRDFSQLSDEQVIAMMREAEDLQP